MTLPRSAFFSGCASGSQRRRQQVKKESNHLKSNALPAQDVKTKKVLAKLGKRRGQNQVI
jgi:hypothetical protein